MESLKIVKKHLGIIFAVAQGIFQSIYWISAIIVAGYMGVGPDGLYWRSAPGGSFFPWPTPSGVLQMITPAGTWDRFFYYLITSWLFLPLAVVLIASTGYFGTLIAKI